MMSHAMAIGRSLKFFTLSEMSCRQVGIVPRQRTFFFFGKSTARHTLAFEGEIQWDIKLMRKVTAMLAGGLFNVKLEGTGMVAITTHHDPLTLQVSADHPVTTDPNATVAWSGALVPEFKSDVSLKTFLGRGSGESIQMSFCGDGFVVVQPYEEAYIQTSK